MQTAERPPLVITTHAAERMAQMGVELSEVLATVLDSETTYPSVTDTRERRVFTRRRLAVVVEVDQHAVVTVLWNRLDGR